MAERKRMRSPAYPSLTLAVAIEKTQVLYQHERRNAAPIVAVLEHWGYEPSNGMAKRHVAALKQYGLLEEDRTEDERMVQLTRLALEIIRPEVPNSRDHVRATQDAALSPKIHREIWEKYEADGLPSDRTLERYLELERNFNPNFVGKFITQFRETIAYANLTESDTINYDEDVESPANRGVLNDNPPPLSPLSNVTVRQWKQKATSGGSMRELPVTLPSLEIAVIRVPFPMSEEDFEALSATLKAIKKSLVQNPSSDTSQENEDNGDDLTN